MAFSRQTILSIFISIIAVTVVSPNAFVSAQISQSNVARANNIKEQIQANKQIEMICADPRSFDYKLEGNKLRIITRNHVCSYKIVQEVLQPQLSAGKIKTFEFSADQEDVIVTFGD